MSPPPTRPSPEADSPFLAEPTEQVLPLDSTAAPGVELDRFGAVVLVCALIVAAIGLAVFISIDEPSSQAFDDGVERAQSPAVPQDESAGVEISSGGVSTAEPPTSGAPATEAPTTAPTLSPATTMRAPSTTIEAATSTGQTVGGHPAVAADVIEVREDKGTKIYVLDNDGSGDSPFDVDSLQIVTAPLHAKEYEIDDGHIRYKSTKDFAGIDSLEYVICNTNDLCATGRVTISVVPK